jgi:hypothetical protein
MKYIVKNILETKLWPTTVHNLIPHDEINMTRFIKYVSRNVTQNHGDSRTSVSIYVPFVELRGISFSY